MDPVFLLPIGVVAALVLFIAVIVTAALTGRAWEREAVAHGAGKFVTNNGGGAEFQWSSPPQQAKDHSE